MKLDTGSPITTSCIPYLLELTNESYSVLLMKIENAKNSGNALSFRPYGSQDEEEGRIFVPYLATNIIIDGNLVPYLLFG